METASKKKVAKALAEYRRLNEDEKLAFEVGVSKDILHNIESVNDIHLRSNPMDPVKGRHALRHILTGLNFIESKLEQGALKRTCGDCILVLQAMIEMYEVVGVQGINAREALR